MAQFLYRIGRSAYDHRKAFVAAWLAVLIAIGALAGLFMGQLSNTFTLPGTETERVLNLMKQEMPELSGGAGSIVFTTKEGQPFTPEQEQAIAQALNKLGKQDPVSGITNPFETQATLDDAQAQVRGGKTEISDNALKLDEARQEIKDGQVQLDQAEQDLADGRATLDENAEKLREGQELLAAGQTELDGARSELDGARVQLDQGQRELTQGRTDLLVGQEQYEAGQQEITSAQKQLAAGNEELAKQRSQLETGINQFLTGVGATSLDQAPAAISAAKDQVNSGIKQANEGLNQAKQAVTDLGALRIALEGAGETDTDEYLQVVADLDRAKAAVAELEQTVSGLQTKLKDLETALATHGQLVKGQQLLVAGEQELAQHERDLKTGQQELQAAAKQLADAKAKIATGEAELAAGQRQYEAGLAQYEAGRAEIAANEKTLAEGEQGLAEGRQQLVDGEKEIADNRKKLEDGLAEIATGQEQLDDAKKQLEQGERMSTLAAPIRFVSENGATAIAQVQFYGQPESLTTAERDAITSIADGPEAAGVQTLFSKEIMADLSSIFGVSEVVGFVFAGVVLMVMLGTVIAAGLPLLMALLGVAIGVGGTLALSSLIEMQSITPALALMLGLAVGIDYSLFIVHRHRTQMLAGMDVRESVARSIGTSGNAVVFAGLTVIIALAALIVPGIPFMAVLGVSAAFTVLVAVLISITLTPALLGFMGEKLLTKKSRAKRESAIASAASEGSENAAGIPAAHGTKRSASRWWAEQLTKRPWTYAIASLVALLVIAIPAMSMQTALPDGGSEPHGSDAQRAYEITSEHFGQGFNGPLIVLAQLPDGTSDQVTADNALLDVAETLTGADGVYAALPVGTNDGLTYGAIQVLAKTGPASPETEAVVHTLRDMQGEILADTGVTTSVTGQVAAQVDVSEQITAALVPYLAIVVGLSLVLLLLVFRSIVVPLLATAGFLLSLAASFGATVAIYQWGWLGPMFGVYNPAPIMSFLPILLTGILFGLAMDYQVFLVTAIREAYAHGTEAVEAIRKGFDHTAPVVVAAALIMISVFSGFVFGHLAMIRPIGFALAIGVLFDAFVVRMTLTPAVMGLLGDKAWYLPKWLDKILPNVDVEGAGLQEALEDAEPRQEVLV
ncbi:MMPL family transporter [Jonesiaceae bacterium BS-20]|uniref:MMPL family transporter n=1 Tax=Jonesiaceae bacterium BS-20 TaxID=3120821 RepID=A0AAU7DUM8_9MICO